MKNVLTIATALLVSLVAVSQARPADTVVIELAKTSKVVFTMKDRSDLETLKQYDFQALFNDLLSKLEAKDTVKAEIIDTTKTVVVQNEVVETWGKEDE